MINYLWRSPGKAEIEKREGSLGLIWFIGDVAAYGLDPVALVTGIFLGYLFHAEWTKLAWGLLLFAVPGMDSIWKAEGPHDALYYAVTEFLAICAITAASYWLLEFLKTRPRRT